MGAIRPTREETEGRPEMVLSVRRRLIGLCLASSLLLCATEAAAQYEEPPKPAQPATPGQPAQPAQPGQPGAAAGKVEEARAIADRGYEQFKLADYATAVELFKQAESISHSAAIVGFIAEGYERLGKLIEASAYYQQLADEKLPEKTPPLDPLRKSVAEAKAKLPLVRQRVPKVSIQVTGVPSADVTVTLDTRPLTAVELAAPISVNPGKHSIVISTRGFEPVTRVFEAEERQSASVNEAFSVLTKEVPVPGPVEREPAQSRLHVAGPAVAYGVGISGVALGVVSGILYLDRASALKERCPDGRCIAELEEEKATATQLGTTATISFAVGGAGLVAGTLWLLFAPDPDEAASGDAAPRAPAAAWSVPELRFGLGGAELRGTF
jgi:hypothetical protein